MDWKSKMEKKWVEARETRASLGIKDINLGPRMEQNINLGKLLRELIKAKDGIVCANIVASHGILIPAPTLMVSDNLRLFVIASRGYTHMGSSGKNVLQHLRTSLHYLKQLRESIEREGNDGPFHDDEGCLTKFGEETLAKMVISMGKVKSYSEYYGVEFPLMNKDMPHWSAFRIKGKTNGKEWEWSAPFLSLKIYDNEYNNHAFRINDSLQARFGILFQYRDNYNSIKTIFLNLKDLFLKWVNATTGLILRNHVYLSDIFDTLEPLFHESIKYGLKFNFTHMSCRVDLTGSVLTKNFSNKGSEASSKHCFIKKFDEKYKKQLTETLYFFTTIYDFYRHLVSQNKYNHFLRLLHNKESSPKEHRRAHERELFEYINGSVSQEDKDKARAEMGARRAAPDRLIRILIAANQNKERISDSDLQFLLSLRADPIAKFWQIPVEFKPRIERAIKSETERRGSMEWERIKDRVIQLLKAVNQRGEPISVDDLQFLQSLRGDPIIPVEFKPRIERAIKSETERRGEGGGAEWERIKDRVIPLLRAVNINREAISNDDLQFLQSLRGAPIIPVEFKPRIERAIAKEHKRLGMGGGKRRRRTNRRRKKRKIRTNIKSRKNKVNRKSRKTKKKR